MKYLVFVLTIFANIVAVKISHFSFSISFANAGVSTRVNASTSASNTPNQNFKFSLPENLKEVSNKTEGESFNSNTIRRISSVSDDTNPNRIPQSLTMGIFGSKPLSSEQILCISFFGKRSEEELTEQDMRAIEAVLKVEDEIKVAPLTRAEAKSATVRTRYEVRAEYEKSLRELFLNGISKELFERVRRKILDEPKDSTQSKQSGVSARDQVLVENQKEFNERLKWAKSIIASNVGQYPLLKDISLLQENKKSDYLIRSFIDNKIDLLEALLSIGIDPNEYETFGSTPLIRAIELIKYEAVDILLRFGADVNKSNIDQTTSPLLAASASDDLKILEIILSAKPNLEIKNHKGETRFLLEAHQNSLAGLKLLKYEGANIFATNDLISNALHLATSSQNSKIEVVEWLIDQGLDINQVDDKNRTPFMNSVENGNPDIMKLLINKGMNVNQKDISGNNSFNLFIFKNFGNEFRDWILIERFAKAKKIIFLLLESGWNPFLQNNEFKTSRSLVKRSLNIDIKIELLKAELTYIDKNGLDSIQELNDTEKSYYRDLLQKLESAQSQEEKENIIKWAVHEDPKSKTKR